MLLKEKKKKSINRTSTLAKMLPAATVMGRVSARPVGVGGGRLALLSGSSAAACAWRPAAAAAEACALNRAKATTTTTTRMVIMMAIDHESRVAGRSSDRIAARASDTGSGKWTQPVRGVASLVTPNQARKRKRRSAGYATANGGANKAGGKAGAGSKVGGDRRPHIFCACSM